jgi:large subunit ribosomal protein L25
MAKFTLKAAARVDVGTRAMRKLRDGGRLPGNIYGHKKENRLVSFEAKEIRQFIQAGHRFLTVVVDGVEENGMLKEVQYASNGTDPIHIDIARIDIHEKITAAVRIETVGIAKGVTAGGNLDSPKREVNLEGPASAIPEKIQIKIEFLEIGQAFRVKDLPPVPECRYLDDPEQVVVTVLKKIEEIPTPTVAAVAPSEPEVIGKKPSEEEVAEAEGKEAEGKKKEKEKEKEKE